MTKSLKKNNSKIPATVKKSILHLVVIFLIHLIAIVGICLVFYLADINVYDNFPIIVVIFSAVNFISAYFTGMRIRRKGMLFGLLYNLPFVVVSVTASLVMNSLTFDLRIIVLPLIYLSMSSAGGITAVNTKSKSKRK